MPRSIALSPIAAGAVAAVSLSPAALADFTGICADVHQESFIGQTYWTVDVYATFDTDTNYVVGFSGVTVASSAGGAFHHTEAHDSWTPQDVPAGFFGLTDSFVTVGNEFGETNTWTEPGADWGPLGIEQPTFPASASWSNGSPENGAGQAAAVVGLESGSCLDGSLASMIGRFVVPDAPTTIEIAGTVEWSVGLLGTPESTSFAASIEVDAEPSSCPGDLDGSGAIDGADLGLLLGVWGPCAGCPADLNQDDAVDGADLGVLLAGWGPCPAP